jgi:predicted XRE-type DNA-binding protein
MQVERSNVVATVQAKETNTEQTTKLLLARKLNELFDTRALSQCEAAAIIGMTQPKVSHIRRYHLQNISLERLLHALVALDQRVEIFVQPAANQHTPGITVTQPQTVARKAQAGSL